MTLRTRLALGLVVIAFVLIVPLIVAHRSMQRLHSDITALRENEFQASLILGRLRDAIADVRAREVAVAVVKTDTVHVELQHALVRAGALADSLARFGVDSGAYRIGLDLDAIKPATDAEYLAVSTGEMDVADSLSQNTIAPALKAAERELAPVERALRARTEARVLHAEDGLTQAEQLSLLSLAVALAVAALVAFWLTRSISRPVRELEQGMRAVADGELQHTLHYDVNRRDEFGRLATSFVEMSRQLAELDKLKAEFVSIASHELKTPINVILGYLQLMQDGVYGPLTEQQVPIARTIQTQARTLARLAGQLLDVSRFEAGGGRIEPRAIRLSTMLDELEGTFHVLAVQRGVEFRVIRRIALLEEVLWDPERMNEVTGNLLSNAFKFTPAGGSVTLTAGPHEDGVCIEVRDSGAGIPAAQLPHVFEKFYQANNQKSASAKGTGLGLAIAKEIVEAHQGSISCESEVGVGTTFNILLPRVVRERRRTGPHHAAFAGGAS